MKHINRYIRFEAETRMAPLSAFAGVDGVDTQEDGTDDGYHEANEDDINMLAQVLGGA